MSTWEPSAQNRGAVYEAVETASMTTKYGNGAVRRVFKLFLTESQGDCHRTDSRWGSKRRDSCEVQEKGQSMTAEMQIKARSCAAWITDGREHIQNKTLQRLMPRRTQPKKANSAKPREVKSVFNTGKFGCGIMLERKRQIQIAGYNAHDISKWQIANCSTIPYVFKVGNRLQPRMLVCGQV